MAGKFILNFILTKDRYFLHYDSNVQREGKTNTNRLSVMAICDISLDAPHDYFTMIATEQTPIAGHRQSMTSIRNYHEKKQKGKRWGKPRRTPYRPLTPAFPILSLAIDMPFNQALSTHFHPATFPFLLAIISHNLLAFSH